MSSKAPDKPRKPRKAARKQSGLATPSRPVPADGSGLSCPHAGLNLRESAFVDYYLDEGGNGTRAAIRAGLTDDRVKAKRIASEMLTNPNVQSFLKRLLELHALSAEMTVYRLSQMAMATLDDAIDIEPDGSGKVNLAKAQDTGVIHLIESITWTDHGPKITLPKRVEVLGLLAKYHGLLVDRTELTVKHDGDGIRQEILAKLSEVASRLASPADGPGHQPMQANPALPAPSVLDVTPPEPKPPSGS